MTASIPVSVPVFMQLVDDQDDILAIHQNNPNDEITALATLVGMIGKAQSWGVDVVSSLLNATPPICVKADAATITVKAGTVWIANSGQSIRLPRRNIADVTVTSSDLDTGSMADDTYYDIFAIADAVGTTFTVKFCVAGNTPSGATSYEKIGWFYNESAGALDITSGFIGNYKRGNRDVPNKVVIRQTADSTDETPTGTYQVLGTSGGGKLFQARFRSNGRPVLLQFNASPTLASTDTNVLFSLQVDSAEVGQGTSYAYGTQTVAIVTIEDLAAGAHTVEVKFKSGTSGSNLHFARADNSAYPSLTVCEL